MSIPDLPISRSPDLPIPLSLDFSLPHTLASRASSSGAAWISASAAAIRARSSSRPSADNVAGRWSVWADEPAVDGAAAQANEVHH